MVLPMTMLAALALPTIRRSVVSLIDWFSVMTFSVVGFAIWAYWIAFMTGFPPRMAQKAQEAVPGFQPPFSLLELGLGLLATAAWIGLVLWRISRQPRPFWRPMALSSGGMVLTWFLLMTLWLPAANFRKSYRDVVSPDARHSRRRSRLRHGRRAGCRATRAARLLRQRAFHPRCRAWTARADGDQRLLSAGCWCRTARTTPHDIEGIASVAAGIVAGNTAAQGSPRVVQRNPQWTLIWHGQRRVSRGERLFLYAREGVQMK